jgi:cytochrome c553
MKPVAMALACCTLLASVSGCKGSDHAGGPLPVAPAPSKEDFRENTGEVPPPAPSQPPASAEQVFSTRCSVCHGPDGKGAGPASATLNPKPRDYTNAAWQKSVSDDQIKKTIVEGGQAVGKSPLMAPNPDLANHPEVVDGLVRIVRGFAKSDSRTL